jgi:hypothetical protein
VVWFFCFPESISELVPIDFSSVRPAIQPWPVPASQELAVAKLQSWLDTSGKTPIEHAVTLPATARAQIGASGEESC